MTLSELSYIIGLLHADGTCWQSNKNKKGKISLELAARDSDIIYALHRIIKSTINMRTRNTNFKKNYKSMSLNISLHQIRKIFIKNGVPVGKKTNSNIVIRRHLIIKDYLRGIIDGDGSVGVTASGLPFINLTTKNDTIKNKYCQLIKKITGKTKFSTRNRRDDIYNISLFKEDAQAMIAYLYDGKGVCLNRKYKKAQIALRWKRPAWMIKRDFGKRWDKEQDNILMRNTDKVAAKLLRRTMASVSVRRWRLTNGKNSS